MKQESLVEVTAREARLIRLIRSIPAGEVQIMVKENQPIRAEEIHKKIRLDQSDPAGK